MLELELKTSPHSTVTKRGLRKFSPVLEDSDFGIVNKKEINKMAKNYFNKNTRKNDIKPTEAEINAGVQINYLEPVEYKMSAELASIIIGKTKGTRNPQETLCEYVNTQCGLKGYCTKVIIG